MKLLQILEASGTASSGVPKVVNYIGNKLGISFVRIPGIDHFHNSSGYGYGVRYVENGGTRAIRFNWNSEGDMGKFTSIRSIDVFNGKSHDPSFNIKTYGMTILQALPAVISVLENPEVGKHTTFPVDPKLAMADEVTESVDPKKDKDKKYPDTTAGVKQYLNDVGNPHIKKMLDKAKFKVDPHVDGVWGVTFPDGLKIVVFLAGYKDPQGSIRKYNDIAESTGTTKITRMLTEAHRDDFTAEAALDDFLAELGKGKTFTRSDFIGRYHPVNVGIFDTVVNNFADRFIIDNRRVSLGSNKGLDKLRDSVLAKAGIVEVTKGGTKEVYLKTQEEEQTEDEGKVPYSDTLEHLEGLVQALIKGSFNALFVAGKGGTGKTQTVEKVLHDNGLTDGTGYFKNTGSASASGIYVLLYHHRNDIILFDDSDGALADQDARNIIKAATDTKKTRKLVWNKKSSFIWNPDEVDAEEMEDDLQSAPQYFDFKGRIIFVSNLPIDKLDPDGALRTRAFVINVDPTDEELFQHMGKILADIKLEDGLSMSNDERERVLAIIKKSPAIKKRGVNIRTLVRALNIAAAGTPNADKLIELYA